MASAKFEVGDAVWRKGSFQEMRIESLDPRSGTAMVSWKDQNDRIHGPMPTSLAILTKTNPRLSDTGPLTIPAIRQSRHAE